ncbi:MAG TPA: histidine kinase [Trebonia sp.]
MHALAEVLVGRDRAPAWRSAAARRTAVALGWVGWLALAASALAAVAIGGRGAAHGLGALGWLAVGLAVSAALPLAIRYALLAWRLAWLGAGVTPLIPGQTRADAGYYAVLAVTLTVAGLRYGPRHLWWMAALSLIPVWVWTGPDPVYPAVNTGWLALLALVVGAVAYWRRDRRALAAQAENTERERERNAVLTDRARIAREMHDVVAHHMSMIAVQAETAQYRLPDTTEQVRDEFASLSAAAREALTEMRKLLGVLRSDGDSSAAERVPQPRLENLPDLVDTVRRVGADVTLDMRGNGGDLPPGVGLTAYRIVQESLANAGRHAPGAAISVVVEEEPLAVRVKVKNEPATVSPPRKDGTGHGLAGMRERVALLGGTLDAGPEADGGFAVRAVLPTGARAVDRTGAPR